MAADVQTDGFTSANITGNCSGTWNLLSLGQLQVGGDLHTSTLTMTDLGKLTVKGWLAFSQILVDSQVGTVTVGGMTNSELFAGVNTTNLPDGASDFDTANPGAIATVLVKGLKNNSGQWVD